MTEHELKILPDYYDAVLNGFKGFEIRKDDRGFKIGDTLVLKEYVNMDGRMVPTGRRPIQANIKYILDWNMFPDGLKEGYCILQLEDVHSPYPWDEPTPGVQLLNAEKQTSEDNKG